jgi:signal transduction histidine kinase
MGDAPGLLDRLSKLAELLNDGETGLSALQVIVELATETTGAVGASFLEFGQSGGRVIAACGELTWALGRPVDLKDPSNAKLVSSPEIAEVPVDRMGAPGAKQMLGRGIRWMIHVVAVSGGTPIGSLQAFYSEPQNNPQKLALIRLLAAWAAHLYTDNTGLPVGADGPVVASLADGLAVVGPDGVVRSWNPAAARLAGVKAHDAVGRLLVFPVPRPGEVLEHQLASGGWIQAQSVVLAGTDAMVVTFRERAPSLRQQEARDLFIALTSHELRTPVTVIRGYADTLVEHWDSLDEAARRDAVFVVGARARELAKLVDRLLSAASDVAGLVGPAVGVPFDLVDALHAVADELSADLRRDLRLDLPAALPKALGDRASLATVVTELVTNACKYSPDRVEVELSAGADSQTVWLRVADRGAGIQPEHVERAFERFWQLEVGDNRRYGGVGLGLYLVRRIVERQRGWVSLRPREGGGTVAEVRLPRPDASPGGA